MFRGLLNPHVLRFYQPFRDAKHGDERNLERVETELFELLARSRLQAGAFPIW